MNSVYKTGLFWAIVLCLFVALPLTTTSSFAQARHDHYFSSCYVPSPLQGCGFPIDVQILSCKVHENDFFDSTGTMIGFSMQGKMVIELTNHNNREISVIRTISGPYKYDVATKTEYMTGPWLWWFEDSVLITYGNVTVQDEQVLKRTGKVEDVCATLAPQ